jgi:hypothetical protein
MIRVVAASFEGKEAIEAASALIGMTGQSLGLVEGVKLAYPEPPKQIAHRDRPAPERKSR